MTTTTQTCPHWLYTIGRRAQTVRPVRTTTSVAAAASPPAPSVCKRAKTVNQRIFTSRREIIIEIKHTYALNQRTTASVTMRSGCARACKYAATTWCRRDCFCPGLTVSAVIASAIAVTTLLLLQRLLPTNTLCGTVWGGGVGRRRRRFGRVQHVRYGWCCEPGRTADGGYDWRLNIGRRWRETTKQTLIRWTASKWRQNAYGRLAIEHKTEYGLLLKLPNVAGSKSRLGLIVKQHWTKRTRLRSHTQAHTHAHSHTNENARARAQQRTRTRTHLLERAHAQTRARWAHARATVNAAPARTHARTRTRITTGRYSGGVRWVHTHRTKRFSDSAAVFVLLQQRCRRRRRASVWRRLIRPAGRPAGSVCPTYTQKLFLRLILSLIIRVSLIKYNNNWQQTIINLLIVYILSRWRLV